MSKVAVVGFGIAGAIMSKQLMDKGFDVHVFNEHQDESPSKVAAGIINPLSVSRKKPLWKAEEFAKSAWRFYAKWDNGFMHRTPMLLDVAEAKLQNEWAGSIAAELGFISWNDNNKAIFINQSGWIDTELLISELSNGVNHFNSIRITDIKDLSSHYEKVILATGKIENEDLGELFRPDIFRPVLGDVLEIESDKTHPFKHLDGLFIIPKSESKYILGSTYIHDFKQVEPDPARAKLLIEKAERQGINVTKVLNHRTAVRPAIYDRMPIVGLIHDNVYAFAGMGSRGLFHAPLAAEMLIESWDGNLLPQIDINRARLIKNLTPHPRK